MSNLETRAAAELEPEQLLLRHQRISILGGNALNLLVIVWHWGEWRVIATVLLLSVTLSIANGPFFLWLAQRTSRSRADAVRMLMNAAGLVVGGHVIQWSVLAWLFLPYHMLWFQQFDPWSRPRMLVFLVLVNVAALADGAELVLSAGFSALGLFGYLMAEKRSTLLIGALREVATQRAQLEQHQRNMEQLHQRALAQEKLSSLGLLAAGVAHEINNPLSFVNSNVDMLLQDMKDEQALSPRLREYVDDVLPVTLDGLRRVNAIITDLRHFSRGDKELPSSYDLNGEIRAALRITQSELAHCDVETELETVGPLFGRPRQVTQVLVNLLVNAGQAISPHGRVRVSARRVGELVRVDIRDTGMGMSAETLQRLFEPFFTTKPPGKGTGLGLAVARAIMTDEGGHIEVESQPGEGTCFSLYLPLRAELSAVA